jgi:hypothetical protein
LALYVSTFSEFRKQGKLVRIGTFIDHFTNPDALKVSRPRCNRVANRVLRFHTSDQRCPIGKHRKIDLIMQRPIWSLLSAHPEYDLAEVATSFEVALCGPRLGEGKTPIDDHLKLFFLDELEEIRQLAEVLWF